MPSTNYPKLSLASSLSSLNRIGPAYLARLNKNLKLKTVLDLIYHFPHRYEDFTAIKHIDELEPGATVTIQGAVLETRTTRTWKRKLFLTEADIEDESGTITALWYNQPYLATTLKQGIRVNLSGKIAKDGKKLFLQNPVHEIIRDNAQFFAHTGRLVPVYPETKGVSSRWLRYQMKHLIPVIKTIPDFLPPLILKKHSFLGLARALKEIHFPTSFASVEQAKARLGFNELFLIQLFLASRKNNLKKESAPVIAFDQARIKNFVASLPFKLTEAQRIVAWEILRDIQKPHPMNRLLNGDVGAGKTVVAALATYQASARGFQSAFMAPTEVLSAQHFETFVSLFKRSPFDIALVSAAHNKLFRADDQKTIELKKKDLPHALQNARIIIGTHALLYNSLKFKNLALVIIDEQHRFGVSQRAAMIRRQSWTPHLLSMSATPIPRTLSLAIYGDLDISILNEMPRGARSIETEIILPSHETRVRAFVREKMKAGEQVFVICPRIQPTENTESPSRKQTAELYGPILRESAGSLQKSLQLEMKAVETEYEKLKKLFPDVAIAKLHGRMSAKAKSDVLSGMRLGEINMLVATSIVEVGIDIPHASIVWVENAERFGLAQLHQFRGRIGRAGQRAWCFLFSDKQNSERLRAMTLTHDGFKLAQKDLEIRGPGEFYGVSQWGFPDLTIGSLADYKTVKLARDESLNVLNEDPELKQYPALKGKFSDFAQKIHLE